jgi:hypothetical protein
VCRAQKIIPSQRLYSFLVNRFYDVADPGFAALADMHHSEVRRGEKRIEEGRKE